VAFATYYQQQRGLIFRFGGASEFRLDSPDLSSERHPDVAIALRATPRDHRGERRHPWPSSSFSAAPRPASATSSPSERNTSPSGSTNTGSSTRSSAASSS
jgi:hypothetical protein